MSEVVNNKAHHRYELAVDGHMAAAYYKLADGVITFVHTELPPELGGKGIGSKCPVHPGNSLLGRRFASPGSRT